MSLWNPHTRKDGNGRAGDSGDQGLYSGDPPSCGAPSNPVDIGGVKKGLLLRIYLYAGLIICMKTATRGCGFQLGHGGSLLLRIDCRLHKPSGFVSYLAP